jgi:hydroxypyruvate isomerase
MQRMLSRRGFVGMSAAALAARALAPTQLAAQAGQESVQISIMMWTLKKLGTFEQNLDKVALAGYHHIQMTGEYKTWSDDDYKHMLGRMDTLKITVDAISGVSAGFADPAGQDAFLAGLNGLIPAAQRLQCKQIILLSGKRIDGAPAGAQHTAAIEALKRGAEVLSKANLVAVIEPIDRIENPPIYLDGVSEAFEIVKAVNSPNVRVLYDIYHEQRQYGNLIEKFQQHIDQVGLIHIADVPGRHEPGTGEIDYLNIYRALRKLDYRGPVAMEFFPTGDVVEILRRARDQAREILT